MDRRILIKILIGLFIFFALIDAIGYLISWKINRNFLASIVPEKKTAQSLKVENLLIRRKIEALQPKGLYIVVDTARNLLCLKQGKRTILMAIVSCGSRGLLKDSSGRREWLFETPKGEFFIQTKYEKPTWIKPDWAFIEEGKPIPKNFWERAEKGALGDYALGFGGGYFIHGTLYTRLLGKNITHGCIRMGDQELKTLYETVPIGTKVLIF